jgi:hypothetical protein
VWSATIPAGILAVLVYRRLQTTSEDRVAVALTVAFGTLILPYSVLLFGHVLAALFGFSAYLLLRVPTPSAGRLAGGGALLGLAVLTEYTMAIVVVAVVTWLAMRHRERVAWVLLGGLPALLALAAYQAAAFGSPFTTAYQWSAFWDVTGEARDVLHQFASPRLEVVGRVFFGGRGLITTTPILLVAGIGLVAMLRERETRPEAVVVTAVALGFVALHVFWTNPYAGGAGPRYVVPALPFLAVPIAIGWRRLSLLAKGLATISILTMISAVLTEPQQASDSEAGLNIWLRLLSRGDVVESAAGRRFGTIGWIAHLTVVCLILMALLRERRLNTSATTESPTLGSRKGSTDEVP